MPRIARNSFCTSFFHVIVQGINKEYIFDKKEYIEKYLELIGKYNKEYNIEILAYCIMNNHAHLLIYSEDCKEMGRFMHNINCIYAQYYNKIENRVGVLFRNRYVSEPIYKEEYLLNCINYIHNNPVKAKMVAQCGDYEYSSYNQYINNQGVAESDVLRKIFGKPIWGEVFKILDSNILFNDIDCSEDDIMDMVIHRFEKETQKILKEIIDNKELFIKLIRVLKENYKIPYTQIAKKCNISRGKFQNFLRKSCK